MKAFITSTIMLLLAVTCSASGTETKLFEEVTNYDGSIIAYKFKASKESLLLMRVIGGEGNPLKPTNPFSPPSKENERPPILNFFSAYGIEFSEYDDFIFDGENLHTPAITKEEADRIAIVMKTLLDASIAQQKLDAWKNENQNQSEQDNPITRP